MENKKQSSVELLYDELIAFIIPAHAKIVEDLKIKQQFKEMHKQEIEEAFTRGLITEDVYYGYDDKKEEKYYNEKFGYDDDDE